MKIKKKIRKVFSVLLISLVLIVTFFSLGTISVSALTDGDYTYSITNNSVTITGYNGSGGEVVIPSMLGGKTVVKIADAFVFCDTITSIVIPDGVTTIDDWAFYKCYSLKKVTIPRSVTTIGDLAFDNCYATIYGSVGSVADSFAKSKNIQFVALPDCLTYEILNGEVIITDCDTAIHGKIIIPSEIEGCPVTTIGYKAFNDCYDLTSVVIPDGVTTIESYAFQHCYDLTTITIPDGVTTIGSGAFYQCQYLKTINIPDSVTTIGSSAFFQCQTLKSINIPDNVTSIGGSAFERCTGLTSITIPDGITSIEGGLFRDCLNLKSVILPDSITSIKYYSFYDCDLTSIDIPDDVTSIGNDAFAKNYNLKEVVIPNGVTSIGSNAFDTCPNLSEITVPDSVTSIEYHAFNGTAYYKNNDNWEDGVLYIGNHLIEAKADVSRDYIIRDGTKSIAAFAFDECTNLTTVSIPDTVTHIERWAFGGCNNLVSISMADSVEFINYSVFNNCTKLTDVWYTGSLSNRSEMVIGNSNNNFTSAKWHYNFCGEEHDYSSNCDMTCSKCEWNREAIESHIYDNDCDEICNKCDFTREIKHDYTEATCKAPKTCVVCGTTKGVQSSHKYSNYQYNNNATCFADGTKTAYCDYGCGEINTISATGTKLTHTYSNNCDKSCNVCGAIRTVGAHKYTNNCDTTCNYCNAKRTIKHTYSNNCDTSCNVCKGTRTITHAYKTTTTKATLSKNGSIVKKCTVCGKVANNTAIKYAKTFKLSATTYTYDGKVKAPTVTVKDSAGKTLKKNTDYTVTYASGRKNVGTYKVTIKMIGKYSGTKTLTFKINPAKTTVSKLTAGSKSITVAITKKSTQVTGYQIQYSTSKTLSKATTKTISSYKTTKYTLKSLSAKKTYYVRVRTYKKVGSATYYSGWSTYKYVKTK